ncbi:MAG TPA: ABC transporter permease [Candidatus Acidoferrum sp.]|nr:ABC transporter permease [Candidatus Acidoferrum sp.]
MATLKEFWARVRGQLGKSRSESELAAELRAHLEMAEEENLRRGMTRDEARHAARRDFGGVEQFKEIYRERRGLPVLETFFQDLRFGARMLRKNPGFTAVAILTLALGIGATTSIFSVVNTLLLRPLPFSDSGRIVVLQEALPKLIPGKISVSAPDVADFRRLNRVFEDLGAFSSNAMDLSGSGAPERVAATRTSAAVFQILKTAPAMGRTFTEDEDQLGNNVSVLSYELWQTKFGADRNILGKQIVLDRQPYTVVGVMPKDFEFPTSGLLFFTPAKLWVPVAMNPFELKNRGDNFNFGVIAKLKSGVTLNAANADVMLVAQQIQQELYPVQARDRSKFELDASVTPVAELIVGPTRTLLMLLLGAVGLLLLIACANVANLSLARGTRRQKEIAVRVAMGAGRMRLVRQLLVESSLLGLIGGAVGLFAAYAGVKGLVVLADQILPRAKEVALDPTVLLFTLGVSLFSGVLFGIIPALTATKTNLNETLKETGRTESSSLGHRRIRDAFVIAQMALALLLVVGSGLLIKSFVRARETDPGFRPENTVAFSLSLSGSQYKTMEGTQSFFDRLSDQARALPGVVSIGASTDLPLNSGWTHIFTAEGHEANQVNGVPRSSHSLVDGDYFQTLGIPLVRGRFFSEAEMHGQVAAVIINDGMAKRYWPGEDPIGKRLKWGAAMSTGPWLTIVGVVGDVKQGPLDAATMPHTYEAFQHLCKGPFAFPLCTNRNVLVRSQISSGGTIEAMRNLVSKMDPQQPIGKVNVMEDLVSASLAPRRFNTWLLAAFGCGALLLAAIGVYGVISYSVAQQTRELGVRIALGAQPGNVLRLVLRRGLTLAAIGLVIGIGASLAATRLMTSLLYNVSATDPVTFATVGALLIAVALAACWIPARRAMRVDPVIALRYE